MSEYGNSQAKCDKKKEEKICTSDLPWLLRKTRAHAPQNNSPYKYHQNLKLHI